MIKKELIDLFRVKERAAEVLQNSIEDLEECRELLYADDRYALLIAFQGMGGAGKDGAIVLKFYLQVSKEEQKRCFMDRHESSWRRNKCRCFPSSNR